MSILNLEQEQAPMPEDTEIPAQQESPELDQKSKIQANLAETIQNLNDKQKQYLQAHLTPETVNAFGLILGPEVTDYLLQFADEEVFLFPMDRNEAKSLVGELQQSQATPPMQGGPLEQPNQQMAVPQPQM